MAAPYIRYANQGATRRLPLSEQLTAALGFLPELGVTMEVFSGGQHRKGEGPRTGSTRHDHGGAADVVFYRDGRQLDWRNPQDVPLFQEIVQRAKANGVTGFGAGDGYMRPGSMHLGFGKPAVWGAGGVGENAAPWLVSAYSGNAARPQQTAAAPTASGYTKVARAGKGWTEVILPDGSIERREGARNWRNNNPGNIEYGKFAQSAGAIGTDGRFAVFPTYEAGKAAKAKLLFESPNYREKTVYEAINRWAPPVENNTSAYANTVASSVGVPLNTPISALSPEQREKMLSAMERVEGFRPGRVNGVAAPAVASPSSPTLSPQGQEFVDNNPQPGGFGPGILPTGSLFGPGAGSGTDSGSSPSFAPQSPFSVPADIAAANFGPKGKSGLGILGKALSALGNVPDAPAPRLGPMPDARPSGGILAEALAAPTIAQLLMKKRFS